MTIQSNPPNFVIYGFSKKKKKIVIYIICYYGLATSSKLKGSYGRISYNIKSL